MTTKTKVILALVALTSAFAAGYYLAPSKTIITEVEKKSAKTNVSTKKDTHKTTTTTKTTKPDGTVTEVTTTTDNSVATREKDSVITDDIKKSTQIVKASGVLRLQALAGVTLVNPALIYGASVSRNIVGPFSLGAWGLTSGQFGVSLGIDL